jgi:hemolysin-activating ACP:hemolysin acyltransferase
VGAAVAEPQGLSSEAVQRAAMHRRMAASFGDIVGLMMQAPQFKHMTLTDLEWLVLPGSFW